jgi:repressor LexA
MLTARQQEIWQFLVDYVDRHGYPPTVREIGEAVGLASPSTVHAHLANLERAGLLRRDPTKPRALDLIGHRRVVPDARPEPAEEQRKLPLLGQIAAGGPLLAEENVEDELGVPEPLGRRADFLLRVKGDSMIEAGIFEGDIVVIRRQDTAENGDIVVALIEDSEATLKRLRRKGGAIALEAANPAYGTRLYRTDQVKIQGKMVGLIRTY